MSNWSTATIGELFEVKGGKRVPKGESLSEIPTPYPYIRVSDFRGGTVSLENLKYVSREIHEKIKRYTISKNDLYISVAGTLGLVGTIPNALDGANLTENANKLCPKDPSNSSIQYFKYLLNSEEIQVQVGQQKGTGGGVPKLAIHRIQDLIVKIPPFKEQQKIASILSSVDRVIDLTEQEINKLKDLKKGMMQELLTTGIGHTKFKDSPVGRIPESWGVVTIKEISKKVTDGTHQGVKFSSEGVPFLYVSCIKEDEINWDKSSFTTPEENAKIMKGRVPEKGDILYTAVGSYGNAVTVMNDTEFGFQRHIAIIKPKKNIILSEFITNVLNSPIGRLQADLSAVGNAQLTVTLGELGKFKIPMPPLEEQAAINERLDAIKNSLAKKHTKYKKLKSLKAGLMQDLLTGKVRVKV